MMPADSTWEYNANAVILLYEHVKREKRKILGENLNILVCDVLIVQTLFFLFFLVILDF